MSEGLEIGGGLTIPLDEVEVRASRSGGPGGQHANKTASLIEAVFDVRASATLSDSPKERIAGRPTGLRRPGRRCRCAGRRSGRG